VEPPPPAGSRGKPLVREVRGQSSPSPPKAENLEAFAHLKKAQKFAVHMQLAAFFLTQRNDITPETHAQ